MCASTHTQAVNPFTVGKLQYISRIDSAKLSGLDRKSQLPAGSNRQDRWPFRGMVSYRLVFRSRRDAQAAETEVLPGPIAFVVLIEP